MTVNEFRKAINPDSNTLLNQSEDRIVERVRQKLLVRSRVGIEKYGCTMERTDIDFVGWMRHLQEELLDAAVYTERLIDEHEDRVN